MARDIEISLVNSRLHSVKFEVKPGPAPKGKISFDLAMSSKHQYDYKKKTIVVLISVGIKDGEMPFSLELVYEGVFKLNKSIPKKDAEPIANINCSAILYPFARETVAEITRRSGFHPLLLPVVNFTQQAKDSKTESS